MPCVALCDDVETYLGVGVQVTSSLSLIFEFLLLLPPASLVDSNLSTSSTIASFFARQAPNTTKAVEEEEKESESVRCVGFAEVLFFSVGDASHR